MVRAHYLVVLLIILELASNLLSYSYSVDASPMIIVPDDYSLIQEAVNAAGSGATVFVRAGIYHDNIVVNKSISLVGQDKMTTVIDAGGTENGIEVKADNVTVTGFTLKNGKKLWCGGIMLTNQRHCNISGNVFTDNYGGIWLFFASDCIISGNNFTGNDYGVGGDHCSNAMIANNYVTRSYLGIGIDESSGSQIVGNVITDSDIGVWSDFPYGGNYISGNWIAGNGFGIGLNFEANITVTGNTIERNAILGNHYGVWLRHSPSVRVTGNNITGNSGYGIELESSQSGNIVAQNWIANDQTGVWLYHSLNNNITGNTMTDNRFGVKLGCSSNTNVSGNIFTNDGLLISDSYHNTINANSVNGKPLVYLENAADCTVEDAGQIVLVNCSRVTVESLTLSNTSAGIELWCTNACSVRECAVAENEYGFYLFASSDNTFNENNLTKNQVGIGLFSSSTNNRIYHNNFIENSAQIYAGSLYANAWDADYPSGGNYWNDYNGSDIYHGLSQNEEGRDGIGDTQYVVAQSAVDHFPLAKPYCGPHDVGMSIDASKNVIWENQNITVTIVLTIVNYGEHAEAVILTYSLNGSQHDQIFDLNSRQSATLTFLWDTTGLPKGSYITLNANVTPVIGERDLADNSYVGKIALVTVMGDVNGDRKVNVLDLILVAGHLGHTGGNSHIAFTKQWHDCVNTDINGDNQHNVLDLILVANHLGQS